MLQTTTGGMKKGDRIEIVLYAHPIEDVNFLDFFLSIEKNFPEWRFRNPGYRVIEGLTKEDYEPLARPMEEAERRFNGEKKI